MPAINIDSKTLFKCGFKKICILLPINHLFRKKIPKAIFKNIIKITCSVNIEKIKRKGFLKYHTNIHKT